MVVDGGAKRDHRPWESRINHTDRDCAPPIAKAADDRRIQTSGTVLFSNQPEKPNIGVARPVDLKHPVHDGRTGLNIAKGTNFRGALQLEGTEIAGPTKVQKRGSNGEIEQLTAKINHNELSHHATILVRKNMAMIHVGHVGLRMSFEPCDESHRLARINQNRILLS